MGAGNRPGRMIIGAIIVKHVMGLSDEETIPAILENPYMQYLVGLKYFSEECIFSPELFVYIRKRSDNDFFKKASLQAQYRLIELSGKKEEKPSDDTPDPPAITTDKDGEKHGGKMKIDATCSDAEVRYPTDINLPEDGSRGIDRLTQKICDKLRLAKPVMHRGRHVVHFCYV